MEEQQPSENGPAAEKPVLSYATPVRHKLVTVATYHQVFEADLARLKLEDNGIQAMLANDNWVALGTGANGVRGAMVQVNEEDAARAKAVLAEVEANRRERIRRREEAGREVKCPRCRGDDVFRRPVSHGMVVGLLVVGGLFLLAAHWIPAVVAWAAAVVVALFLGWEEFRCRECGCAWTPKGDEDDEDDDPAGRDA